jgi:cell division protein FtsA
MENNNEIVVALDIGTTKIVAMAGRKDVHGKLEILGIGKVESVGVIRGVVSNIEKTVKAISDAIAEAERRSGLEIAVINVGIAGQHIKSLQHRGIHTRNSIHDEISHSDIDSLISDMYKLALPPGDKIIHVIPQEYIVDAEQGIVDPVGMSGVRLEANFHIITGQITAIKNLQKCVEKSDLEMAGLTLEPIASAAAVLSKEEMEAGIALVDIGGGTTDIAIFHEGIIRHTAVIPFGGNVITKDIKEGCSVMQQQAEKLKVKFGSALASEIKENRIVSIAGLKGHPHKEISERNLAHIIQARMEEIIDQVYWEIRKSGFERKLSGGIVLTGGGSLLKNLEQLVEFRTGMNARTGIPVEHLAHGYEKEVASPVYSTAIGLVLKGFDDIETGKVRQFANSYAGNYVPAGIEDNGTSIQNQKKDRQKSNWFDKIYQRTKTWFESEPDADLK